MQCNRELEVSCEEKRKLELTVNNLSNQITALTKKLEIRYNVYLGNPSATEKVETWNSYTQIEPEFLERNDVQVQTTTPLVRLKTVQLDTNSSLKLMTERLPSIRERQPLNSESFEEASDCELEEEGFSNRQSSNHSSEVDVVFDSRVAEKLEMASSEWKEGFQFALRLKHEPKTSLLTIEKGSECTIEPKIAPIIIRSKPRKTIKIEEPLKIANKNAVSAVDAERLAIAKMIFKSIDSLEERGFKPMKESTVVKKINHIMVAAKNKVKNLEAIKDFSVFVYREIETQFSERATSQRRFIEFVTSAYCYETDEIIGFFFKAIAPGVPTLTRELSFAGILLFVKIYNHILNTASAPDQMLLSRSVDGLREFVEPMLPRVWFNDLVATIENKAVEDTNKLKYTKSSTFVVETITAYEGYRDRVKAGLRLLAEDFFCRQTIVKKVELLVIFRHLAPSEDPRSLLAELEEKEDPLVHDLTDSPELYFSEDLVYEFCVSKKILSIDDVDIFIQAEEYPENQLHELIEGELRELKKTLCGQKVTGKVTSLSAQAWEEKFEMCEGLLAEGNEPSALLLYRIFKAERNFAVSS